MIPSGYKEDTIFSAIPTDGSGDLSFTRASNGTRVNSAGLVEVCPWNEFENSNLFTSWTKSGSGVTITSGQTDPIGGTNAFLYARTLAFDYILDTLPSNKYTVFCTVKKGASNFFRIAAQTVSEDAVFNVNTGVIDSTSGGVTATIQSLGDGWYKCIAVFDVATTGFFLQNFPVANGSNGSGSVYIYQAQANIGATAKPYFPTTDRLNVPRLTYQNGGGGCPSLLLEKQSTNALTYSEDFTQADWPKQNTIVTANATTSPDGTQNADKLIANTTNARHLIFQAITTSNTHTFTTYAKAGENSFLIMRLDADSPEVKNWFNLSNGTVGTSQGGSPTITSVGNGWYRCSMQYTPSTSSNIYAVLYTAKTDGVEAFAGNDSDGTYIWGAQLEASSYPTSYIPTTSSSATRVVDACFKTGISSLIGQTEGVAFIDFDFNGNYSSGGIIPFSLDGGAGNELYAWIQTNGTVIFEVYNAFVGQVVISGSIGAVGRKKIAFAYKQNDFAVYLNGTQVGTDTSGTVPTMSRLFVGKYYANDTYNINAGINQTILFPTRLTNAELASLTTI
jgi:hypothetical protein